MRGSEGGRRTLQHGRLVLLLLRLPLLLVLGLELLLPLPLLLPPLMSPLLHGPLLPLSQGKLAFPLRAAGVAT